MNDELTPRAALGISTELYWLLPSPRAFLEEAAEKLTRFRALAVRLPATEISGLHRALEGALERLHITRGSQRWLKIADGMEIANQIGAALKRKAVSPEELAVATPEAVHGLVLEAEGSDAARNCEAYLQRLIEFMPEAALDTNYPRVLALLPEALEPLRATSSVARALPEIRFSGALTPDEIAAYVGARMAKRPDPGRTGLLRHLVIEFAAFDVHLAERLIALPNEMLLGLPWTLEGLAAESELRWRSGTWSTLCYAEIDGHRIRHTLHEITQAKLLHQGPEQREAQDSLKRKYWRACVRSLLPYLEEHRDVVMAPLRAALDHHAKATGGKLVRPTVSGRLETKNVDDAEFNDVVGLVTKERFEYPRTPKALQAVEICKVAKRVRDDIAHLRSPPPDAILRVTALIEAFVR